MYITLLLRRPLKHGLLGDGDVKVRGGAITDQNIE
jgi:hypothetical protein